MTRHTGMKDTTLAGDPFSLGTYLRDRRSRLQPAADARGQRRTPGLRREEVSARAGVSVTWYTWLEQGRGGPPSDQVLERLSNALELDAAGREALFLLAQHRPPPLNGYAPSAVTPSLQRVLDAMPTSLAYVKTLTWDVVSWNKTAATLTDIAHAEERNVLRRLFGSSAARVSFPDWEEEARFCLAAFRLDLARTGSSPEAAALVSELKASSSDFRRLWATNEMSRPDVHLRRFHHPVAGELKLECSTFSVDNAAGLSLLVHTPSSQEDAEAIATILAADHLPSDPEDDQSCRRLPRNTDVYS